MEKKQEKTDVEKHIEQAEQMAKFYDKEVIAKLKEADDYRMKALKERLLVVELKKQKDAETK